MAIYAIGDVQGCYDTLRRLIDTLDFEPRRDQLWFAGDLVNRGPQSLETLRFVRGLGAAGRSVLGNHDLHLLALAHGGRKGKRDTLETVLTAPDRDELLDWLRHLPLLLETPGQDWAVLHAGLAPQWDMSQARACAREAEAVLSGPDFTAFLDDMYGDQPDTWDDKLRGTARLRFTINCYTRLRYCDTKGRAEFASKGAPGSQPKGLLPWFAVPKRRSAGTRLVFGHWSTLGQVLWPEHRVYGLDTGAVWGGRLSALRLDDERLYSVASPSFSTVD
jgi:bis(5'-nucleosyl)-tetraphosphatase (symmetrical)